MLLTGYSQVGGQLSRLEEGAVQVTVELEIALRLLMAAALGAIVGFQRERMHKPAGLRTHMLICVGSALFTVVSIHGFGTSIDISRVASGVVTGIGFLGAGAIISNREGAVVGLTTAAAIWAVAAIGMAVGSGLYIASVVVTVIVLIILYLPHHIR
jgi:putative Mg2+ transporter-C (MgtC) family protein